MRVTSSLAVIAFAALAACGSGNESFNGCGSEDCFVVTPVASLAQRQGAAQTAFNGVGAFSPTTTAQMDRASGSTVMTGPAQILVNPSYTIVNGQRLLINQSGISLGDAPITVDLDNDKLSGSVRNVIEQYGGNIATEFDGALRVANGTIGQGSANAATARYSGTLTTELVNNRGTLTTVFAGDLAGQLRGAGANALALVDSDGSATFDGRNQDIEVIIAVQE